MNVDEQNVRTFRDFLHFYNNMSETCFINCVDTFNSRELEKEEISCIERCSNKFIRFNHRSIGLYAEAQTKLVAKRVKDMEIEQEKAQQKLDEQMSTVENVQEIVVANNKITDENHLTNDG